MTTSTNLAAAEAAQILLCNIINVRLKHAKTLSLNQAIPLSQITAVEPLKL